MPEQMSSPSTWSKPTDGVPVFRLQEAYGTVLAGPALGVSWPNPTTPGSLLVAVIMWTGPATIYMPGRWTQAAISTLSSNEGVRILFMHDADSRAGDEVVVSPSATARIGLQLIEYAGLYTGLAVTQTSNGSASPASTGTTAAFIDANALAIAALVTDAGSGGTATIAAPSNGFTAINTLTGSDRMAHSASEKLGGLTVAGESTAAVVGGATKEWAGAIAVFSADNEDPNWASYSGVTTAATRPMSAMGAG